MAPVSRSARATILVVEDDPAMARTLIDALELADYRVWHAVDGADARSKLELARPDLILLDLILPDVDGLVLCYTLKSASHAPIVICSGTNRRRDPILALKLGADDFVHKPFELEDLLARIEAVLRRAPPHTAVPQHPPELRVGELVIEPARHRVQVGSVPLALTPTEFRLLTVLAARPDEVLSRDELAHEVWGYADASHTRTIDVHVRRLRAKLAHVEGVTGPTIVSVRGAGYRLSAPQERPASISAA
jgi:two-component system response regulator MtrA